MIKSVHSRKAAILAILLFSLSFSAISADTFTSAVIDLSCAGTRKGNTMNCTANEFAVNPSFSAAPGTEPFCVAGQTFEFIVDLELSGANTNRYDAGFFVGQTGNDPAVNDATQQCSVATFPMSSAGSAWWFDSTAGAGPNTCGDFAGASGRLSLVRIDKIKVVCQNDGVTGDLAIPYVLTYNNGSSEVCTGPANVINAVTSKCIKGAAKVNGVESVSVGAWLDVIKQTSPDGNTEDFTYTATGPVGSKIMALVGATFGPGDAHSGGSYVGPGGAPITLFTASNTAQFTLKDGQQARVFIAATNTPQTVTVVESLTAGWDPDALSISCSNQHGTPVTDLDGDVTTRSMSASLTSTNYAGSCTITNRKRPAVTITKISNGDVATFNFTGTNTWASQNIATATSGVGVAGVTQYLPVGVATTITETAAAGYRMENISCTTSAGTATTDITARTATLDAAAMGAGQTVNCTFTNRRQRTLTTTKSLSPLADSGLFVMNANGSTSAEGGNGTSVNRAVDVGATVTASEVAGTGTSLANYTTSYSCNTAPATTGNTTSVNFTMPNADTTCTFTNTRKSASLVLRKTWANAINGNTATVTSSGFTNNASSGASVSTGNNTTTGASVTVYSAEAGNISESFSVGNSNNYNASLACSGNSTALSGNTLTINPADTAITCTYTNARKSANLTLQKTWSGGVSGHTATVISSGFTNNATSGASVSTVNNTTTGTPVTVYAAESGTISESFSVGNAASYVKVLSCTGNTTALAGSTLTIDPADTSITCTYTNNGPGPNLTATKSVSVIDDVVSVANDKAIPGATMRYTIVLQNTSGAFSSDSIVVTDNFDDSNLSYVPGSASTSSGTATVSDTDADTKADRLIVTTPSIPAGGTVTVTFDVVVD